MAYLGKGTKSIDHATISTHTMTGDGSDTTMSITLGTTSVNNVSVFISGVQQRPGQDYTIANDVITFTTAPEAGWPVIAFVRKDTKKGTIADASVGLDTIKDGAVTDAKIVGLSASKLTGALPAIDGSALTGISAVTTSVSDPAIDTNTTLGAVWVNKTSGNTFVCTDATTDANVWTNVGAGSGTIGPKSIFQGTISGYTSGGQTNPSLTNIIDKFSLVTDADATDHGDLTVARAEIAGTTSSTHGYSAGGGWDNGTLSGADKETIDKFAFGSNNNATDVGNLTVQVSHRAGQSDINGGYGYASCGSPFTNVIDKYSFSSDGNSVDRGDLTGGRYGSTGQNSTTQGFNTGGYSGAHNSTIDKFDFANGNNAVGHGDLANGTAHPGGCSSTTDGFALGNQPSATRIERFSFASNTTATQVGDMSVSRGYVGGVSSTTHGYSVGGNLSTWYATNVIDKFSYASESFTAGDVGDLTTETKKGPGTHNE